MQILQVVTLLGSDGAYGGPARVALNQSAELIKRGHQVTVAAATRDHPDGPSQWAGVPVRLFKARTLIPGTGFAGVGAPGLAVWLRHHAVDYDIIHIHFGRDLVVLPAGLIARRRRVPYVLQTHGMVVPSRHPLAGPFDAMWTRKILHGAGAVFYLNPLERAQVSAVAGSALHLAALANGVPDYPAAAPPTGPPEVLFAARMHPRKRPLAFVEMAKTLLARGIEARFTLVGPDEGEGPALRAAIAGESRISWEGATDPLEMVPRMAAASVYVLPSVNEPYPMAVLEAMSVGLPVIVSDDCGLAALVKESSSGIVTEATVPALTAAVESVLADRSFAMAMGERGRTTVRAHNSMAAIGDRLVEQYSELVGGR